MSVVTDGITRQDVAVLLARSTAICDCSNQFRFAGSGWLAAAPSTLTNFELCMRVGLIPLV
jgi:hypothetical protein